VWGGGGGWGGTWRPLPLTFVRGRASAPCRSDSRHFWVVLCVQSGPVPNGTVLCCPVPCFYPVLCCAVPRALSCACSYVPVQLSRAKEVGEGLRTTICSFARLTADL